MNRKALLSMFIGFTGRAFIATSIPWIIFAISQGKAIQVMQNITPLVSLALAAVLILAFALISRAGFKIASLFEFKTKSFGIQIFLMLVLAMIEIPLAVYSGLKMNWPLALIIMMAVDYLGILLSKHAGATSGDNASTSFVITTIAVILLASTFAFGKYLVGPIHDFFSIIWNGIKYVVGLFIKLIKLVLYWISTLGKPSSYVPHQELSIEDFNIPDIEIPESNPVAQMIFLIGTLLIALAVLVEIIKLIVKYLSKLSFSKKGKLYGQSERIEKAGFKQFLREIVSKVSKCFAKISALIKINSHKKSVAYVLKKIEKICRKSSKKRHQDGETAREFIMKLKGKYTGNRPELFSEFADCLDCAIYGPEKTWLAEFANAKIFIKEVRKNV